MANPTFAADGVDTITLSRDALFPKVSPRILNQFVGITDANTVTVSVAGSPLQTILLPFEELTREDRSALEGFFAAIDYSGEFTFTDSDGDAYVCRFLEPQFAIPEVTDNNMKFEIVLTVVG